MDIATWIRPRHKAHPICTVPMYGEGLRNWDFLLTLYHWQHSHKAKVIKSQVEVVVVTYINLMADIAIQGVEEMYEYWKDTEFFKQNEKFRLDLTSAITTARNTYDRNNFLLGDDKSFFLDLCDAAQVYIKPVFYDTYERYKAIYKRYKFKRYNLLAYAYTNLTMLMAVVGATDDLRKDVRHLRVDISGISQFSMVDTAKFMSSIITNYGTNLSDLTSDEWLSIPKQLLRAVLPENLVKEAGLVAMALHPDKAEAFMSDTAKVFPALTWDDN